MVPHTRLRLYRISGSTYITDKRDIESKRLTRLRAWSQIPYFLINLKIIPTLLLERDSFRPYNKPQQKTQQPQHMTQTLKKVLKARLRL